MEDKKVLETLGTISNHLRFAVQEAIDYVNAHPNDPRGIELLKMTCHLREKVKKQMGSIADDIWVKNETIQNCSSSK